MKKDEILFVASAAWDAAGANWFGYPVFWVNRPHAPKEELELSEVPNGSMLSELKHCLI